MVADSDSRRGQRHDTPFVTGLVLKMALSSWFLGYGKSRARLHRRSIHIYLYGVCLGENIDFKGSKKLILCFYYGVTLTGG